MLSVYRRGFTLVEVMLSLFLTLVVTGAIYSLLLGTQRVTLAQGQRISLQSSIRAGSFILLHEFSELGTVSGGTGAQNDIIASSPSAVTYRAMRGVGFICQMPAPSVIRVARSTFSGHRDPQAARDEAYVFVPGKPTTAAGDAWVAVKIVQVATASTCPGNVAAITLTVASPPSAEMLEVGTPVRITELMELRLYRAEGRSWLGARSVSSGEAIQPLIGPLADAKGFDLEYLDGFGVPTNDRTRIRSIRSRLRGILESGGVELGSPLDEELVTQVALRNSLAS
jgi:prepilin-type N-terminal cleavage/methylation domain-containing protein